MKAKSKTKSPLKKIDNGQNLKALLFDFGGTLAFLDYELLAREFSRPGRKLDALGLELAEYRGRAMIDRYMMSGRERDPNRGYEEFFREWLGAAGIPEEEIRECGERFQKIHREATLWRVVRPGTREALERLRRAGYKLAIVSNAEGQVEGDAHRFGLAEFFDTIIDSHVVGVAKPDPRIFQIALERLRIAPNEARYAGDIYSIDMLGARAAGIDGRLIDQHNRYDWVDHPKIRAAGELHRVE
ncbi:MAG TPA: HAD family hydrolase [Candidatus Binataceae bacterium]|nr:HAD family hydrolase [Candidatus Binataceae bacterium]